MKQDNSSSQISLRALIYLIIISVVITVAIFYYLSDNSRNIMSGMRGAGVSVNNIRKEDLNILDEAKFKEDYIYVDLSNMTLSTFSKGEKIKSFEIVSKGKPGSYYETPAGNYEVVGKFGNKFSSLGEVYMPSAIQFLGNYFIHGIPYYTNGEKVSSAYSGGCIRLNDNDAAEVYAFANKGVKIVVTSSNADAYASEEDLGQEISSKLFYILISLDVSNQERSVNFDGSYIKALNLIPLALKGDDNAYKKILNNIPDLNSYRNLKLKALGISDPSFGSYGDRIILYNYIKSSKSYLLNYL